MDTFNSINGDGFNTIRLELIVGFLSSWEFHAMFLPFNISVFIAVSFKYGIFITFASIDNSYYSVVYALVIFY